MKIKLIFFILFFALFVQNDFFAQNYANKIDTSFSFLLGKCFELFAPHSELTYSFGTTELKNEIPDLAAKVPNLKDTSKFFEELKGNYSDWFIFYKIGNLYQGFNQGQNAMNYYNQAYNLILAEIKKDTLNSKPFSDMGNLYLNLNSGENAFYFFKRAYSLNEKDSAASMFLPMFYIFNGDLVKAEELVRKRLTYDPRNTDMYIWLMTSKIYQSIGKLNKENQSVYNQTIDELFDLHDIKQAAIKYKNDIRFPLLEQLVRQLALFAKYSIISDNFKEIKLSAADQKEVKNIQKKLLEIIDKKEFKNKYIVYKSLGINYLLDKNTEKAKEYLNKTIGLWPKDKNSKDFYILFSVEYFIRNDTLAALKVIDQKIQNDIGILLPNAEDHLLKGNVLLQKGDFVAAKAAYQKALEVNTVPNAYLAMSIPRIKEKDFEGANQLINKAYELNKENYLSYALFGIISILNNQKDKAKISLEKALELKPDEKIVKEIYETFFPK